MRLTTFSLYHDAPTALSPISSWLESFETIEKSTYFFIEKVKYNNSDGTLYWGSKETFAHLYTTKK